MWVSWSAQGVGRGEWSSTWRAITDGISRYDERGPAWYWNNFSCGEHTGTHFDAPIHWVTGKDQDDVSQIPPGRLVGPAALLRALVALGAPVFESEEVRGGVRETIRMTGPAIFGLMIWVFYLRFTVPVLGVFYGTSLIADEVEDKTITYLFTRPIAKGSVLVGKYLAYLVCTIFVVLPSVMLVYLLIVPMQGSLGGSFLDLL